MLSVSFLAKPKGTQIVRCYNRSLISFSCKTYSNIMVPVSAKKKLKKRRTKLPVPRFVHFPFPCSHFCVKRRKRHTFRAEYTQIGATINKITIETIQIPVQSRSYILCISPSARKSRMVAFCRRGEILHAESRTAWVFGRCALGLS